MRPTLIAVFEILFSSAGLLAQEERKAQYSEAAKCLIEAEWPLIEELSIKTRLSQSYLLKVVGVILRDVENPEEMIKAYTKIAEDFGDDPSGLSASRRIKCLEPLLAE